MIPSLINHRGFSMIFIPFFGEMGTYNGVAGVYSEEGLAASEATSAIGLFLCEYSDVTSTAQQHDIDPPFLLLIFTRDLLWYHNSLPNRSSSIFNRPHTGPLLPRPHLCSPSRILLLGCSCCWYGWWWCGSHYSAIGLLFGGRSVLDEAYELFLAAFGGHLDQGLVWTLIKDGEREDGGGRGKNRCCGSWVSHRSDDCVSNLFFAFEDNSAHTASNH